MPDQQWNSCFVIALGAWLVLSPWVLECEFAAAVNSYAVGAGMIFVAAIPWEILRSLRLRKWRDGLLLAIGFWLIISPWLLHLATTFSQWNAIILGSAIILSLHWTDPIGPET